MPKTDDANYTPLVLDILKDYEDKIRNWEFDFLTSLKEWDGEYSEKQVGVIERIADKLGLECPGFD